MEARSVRFAAAARSMAEAARRAGFAAPTFRSPPKVHGAMRTIRRHSNGSATISLVVKDRPWFAVVADMIDGFVAVNSVAGELAPDALRDVLWATVERMDVPEQPTAIERPVHILDDAA